MKKVILFVLFALCSTMMLAQETITVKGTVISSEDGLPVIGAYVLQQGTNNGTSTDVDGNFTIEVPKLATLVVKMVGFHDQEIAVQGRAILNISLAPESVNLEEVMVVAYGTAKKGTFTGAASVVKKEAIADVPSTSFENALNGKIAGLEITQSSGQAGSTSEIRIRGIGSMNASNEPLYVIDGVPVMSGNTGQLYDNGVLATNNVMNTLNPSDIESITVLKDAAASALYGSRAANGVIMVTTKRGKQGKPTVSFKASVGITPDWATKNYEVAGPEDQIQMLYEIYHDYITRDGGSDQEANTYAIKQLGTNFNRYGYNFATNGIGLTDRVQVTGRTDGVLNYDGRYFDWDDAYFGTAVYQSYDLAVSGGNENTSYYSSFAYTSDQGRIAINTFERLSGRVNVNQKVGKHFEFATNINVAYTDKSGFNDSINNGSNYFMQTRNQMWPLYWPIDYKTGNVVTERYRSYAQNNLYHQTQWDNYSKTFRVQASETLTAHLLEGLDLKTVFSYDNSETKDHIYYSPNHYNASGVNGSVSDMSTNYRTLVSSTTLNYNTTIAEKHNISLLAGFEAEDKETSYIRASGENLPTSSLHSVATAGTLDANAYSWGNSMASILSRVEYNYDDKYYVSGSFRRDGSSKLSPDTRWGNFWSVAGSWRINNENFMKDIDWLSSLRLRASYGVNGTLPSDNYGWRALTSYTYNYRENPGAALSNTVNEGLSWETSYTYNVALEFGLFDQRITGTVEYFNRDSKDLLQDVPISTVTGFSSTLQNIGEINNKGFEIELSGDIIKGNDFNWSAGLTASLIKSKVVELYDGEDINWYDPTGTDSRVDYIYREGEAVLSVYGYEWAGVNPDNGLNMWYVNNPEKEASLLASGDAFAHYKDGRTVVEGDTYSECDKVILGDLQPKIYGGLNTNLSYKGIDLGLNFTYRLGATMYDSGEQYVNEDGYFWQRMRLKKVYEERWQKPGDITTVPKLLGNDPTTYQVITNRFMHTGDYLRLKNITVAYNFPKKLIKKVGLSSARVYFNGTNLFTWSAYDVSDPEVNAYGTRGWETPVGKTYTFGIDLTF